MGVPMATARGTVNVSHHMFYLTDDGLLPQPPFTPTNGLVVARPGAAVIFTGASSGVVEIQVEVHGDSPPMVSTDGWDEVVETTVQVPRGRLAVDAPMANAPDLPVLTPAGPGSYRIRVHARGRDTAPDIVAFEPAEHYLITVWPSPPAPEAVHKQTDRYGETLRQSAAQAPSIPLAAADNREAIRRRRLEDYLRQAASRLGDGDAEGG
jgi:hypothetical protein